jgi:hypothetical protein
VVGINTDDFKEFMSSILWNPIWVKNSQGRDGSSDSFFGNSSHVSVGF